MRIRERRCCIAFHFPSGWIFPLRVTLVILLGSLSHCQKKNGAPPPPIGKLNSPSTKAIAAGATAATPTLRLVSKNDCVSIGCEKERGSPKKAQAKQRT